MQQHLSAEAQSTVYLLSGAVTTSILNMNLSALRCHHNSPNFHWWSVKQSDKATEGVRVSYRFDPDPTCIFMWWHTPTREAMNVWTGRLSSCMYMRAVSVAAPSCSKSTENQGCDERWESADGCYYHDEAGGDWVVTAVAQLPEFGPVVLLAEEASIFFIIPVGQRCAALTTPEKRKRERDSWAVEPLINTF